MKFEMKLWVLVIKSTKLLASVVLEWTIRELHLTLSRMTVGHQYYLSLLLRFHGKFSTPTHLSRSLEEILIIASPHRRYNLALLQLILHKYFWIINTFLFFLRWRLWRLYCKNFLLIFFGKKFWGWFVRFGLLEQDSGPFLTLLSVESLDPSCLLILVYLTE